MKPKRILSFLLATAMTISLLPTFTLTASAGETPTTTTEKNITLYTSALSGYDSTNGYKYVYYGTYQQNEYTPTTQIENPQEDTVYTDTDADKTKFIYRSGKYYKYEPIKWRILSMNGNEGTYKNNNNETVDSAKAMFLLSEYALKTMAYDSDGTKNDNSQIYVSDWRYSDAWNWCNDTFISSSFTDSESAYFLKTSKANARSPYTDELKGDTFFFLSIDEANSDYIKDNRVAKMSDENGSAVWWWLRSPIDDDFVFCVYDLGFISLYNVSHDHPAARPAFNLNLSSVLFTSAAKGGKSSTAAAGGGAGIFENVDLDELEDNDGYKLTMLDESRKDFSASLKSLSGNTATVSYSGAKTGTTETKEYISVIIKNGNDVKYYGRACEVSSASGEVDITLPSDFDEAAGDLLCVFNEQINGDYKTDYASNFVTVVTTETGLKNAVQSNGTVVLGKDITISETLEIGKNVILDLAGFTLKKTGGMTNYGVIKVNENTNFTLKDSSTAHTGKITGGNADNGGVVYVDSNATFNMKGGIIYCSNENNAVIVANAATVKNDSQTSATVCYGNIDIYGKKSGNIITFSERSGKIYATELIPDNGTVVIPENPTAPNGYTFDGWYTKDGTNDDWGDEFTPETTITEYTNLFARWTAIPADEPMVSGSDVEVTYGSCTNETISVTVNEKDEKTYSYSYQWYDSSKNEISGETKRTYTIPNDLAVGSYDYYCVVTAERNDNGETETTEKEIKVTVNKAGSQTTVTTNNTSITYGDTLTLTATVGKPKAKAIGNDDVEFYLVEDESETLLDTVKVVYADTDKKDEGTATLTIDTKKKELKIGDNTITAQYGGSVNLNGSEKDTITVTLNPKEVGLSWIGYATRDYDEQPSTVKATTNDFVDGDDVSLTVTGGDKTNASTYTATASLSGKDAKYYTLLTNDTTQKYTINPKTVTATISTISNQTYTGSEIKPTITAYDGTTVIPTSEYTVGYSNNENAGTATVTITNNTGGNYTVSGSTTFEILPKSIDGATVGTFAAMTYNGTEQTPSATVTIDGLTATGVWSDVKNVSDKTTFTADGNFKGTISDITPNMEKKSIADATVALDGELAYNGQPQTQNVTLTLGGFTNVTFDVSANEQTDVNANGNYTLAVTGTGNFTGTKTLDWNIKPHTPTENPNNKTTARVRRGRTLADATVTNGEMLGVDGVTALEGTFAWVDNTKAMSADGTEQMIFTPTNTNYAPIIIDVAVSTYSSGGGGTSRYTVKFDTDGGNTITNQTVTKNSKATKPTAPTKEGYIFDGWYTDSKFTTEYDFDTKVTKNITLYAKWTEKNVDDNTDDNNNPTPNEWKNPFTDVTSADWFFDNVRYANENGLMSGTTDTTFAPNDNLTRGMLVTVLYRAEGEPVVNYAMPFTDIIDTAYYAEAVRWAASENIVNGVTETEFAPDENITREQIATIIYRYAKYMGYDVSVGEDTNILSYTDFDEISEYAIEAMQYAVGMGLMKGKTESTLNPKDNATRAEIAAILQRFIESNK